MELAEPMALLLAFVLIPILLLAGLRSRGVVLPGFPGGSRLPSTWRIRWMRLLPLFRVLAVLLLVAAIARPREGQATTIVPAKGIDIALSLDLSGSMAFARFDEGMNRLEGAKQVIREFIASRPDDRIGLAVFQRSAIPLSPPTLDHDALDAIVADLETGLLRDGTAIGLGLAAAVNLLVDSPAASRVVILLTDGVHNAHETIHPLDAVELAKALDVRVYTVGVAGAQAGGGTVEDDLLTEMAEATGGRYYRAESFSALADVYEEISALETSGFERERFIEYREYGPWLAAVAVVLLLLDLVLRGTVFRRVTA
jgi:Ca-activated chloride channel homolog